MKRFSYLRDPLFLLCCIIYVVNRWGVKPYVHISFFHNWLADILLIPCALPPLLLLHRRLNLRTSDCFPTALEIIAHLAGWSLLFEWIGPHLMRHTTRDLLDVVAYAIGGLMAFLWWNRDRLFSARLSAR